MSIPPQNFNPRLIISDHFDRLINKIDIKTETLLQDEHLTSEKINDLNKIRNKQIEKIKEISQLNLSKTNFNQEEFSQKLVKLQEFDLDKQLNLIKEEIILIDCILLEQTNMLDGFELWIISFFLDETSLEFLK